MRPILLSLALFGLTACPGPAQWTSSQTVGRVDCAHWAVDEDSIQGFYTADISWIVRCSEPGGAFRCRSVHPGDGRWLTTCYPLTGAWRMPDE